MKTRRDFLRSTVLGASAAWTVPMFIERTFGQLHEGSKDLAIQGATGKDDTILVVLQLAGGNDGLNTLVPFADDAYHAARPKLGKKEKEIIKLSDHVGLNAAMPFLGSMFKEGNLGIVQGMYYVPQGLDVWAQLECGFPGHYAREQERCDEQAGRLSLAHWSSPGFNRP